MDFEEHLEHDAHVYIDPSSVNYIVDLVIIINGSLMKRIKWLKAWGHGYFGDLKWCYDTGLQISIMRAASRAIKF